MDQGGAGGGVAQQIWLAPETTEVVRAARWLQEIAPALQLDVRTLGRIDVCLEEMLTNAVCYGEVTGMIDVVLRRLPVRAVMVIADRGLPFNPLARPDASESGDLDSASDGGRGIRIVRQLTCASDYRRVGDVNRLTLEFGPLAPLSGEHPATVVGQDESQ